MSHEPRLVGRDEILAALKRQRRVVPIEVTERNVDEMRRAFADDVAPGNIVWTIPNTPFDGIIYSECAQQAPLRGVLRWPQGGHVGKVMVIGEDLPCLRDGTGLLISLLTGEPIHVIPSAPSS